MRRMVAVAVSLAVVILILGCQAPKEFMEKIEKQLEATEELQTRVDDLEAKLDETAQAYNDLAAKFDEHMSKYHKKKVTTPRAPKIRPPATK